MQISPKTDVEISDTLTIYKQYTNMAQIISVLEDKSLWVTGGVEYVEATVCGRLVRRCEVVALLNQRDSLLGGSVIQGEGVHVQIGRAHV
jgi:hypothetical protein